MDKIDIKHDPERYENIFNMYEFKNSNDDKYVFYNILSKVTLPPDLDKDVFAYYNIDAHTPLTTLSYKIYGTQHLWWLIMVVNNIKNPVKLLESGSIIKVIKKDYLDLIFDSIKKKP
jgi:hypothetical protein